MDKTVYIGCSGYYYPAWKKGFYPAGIQPKQWLEYYSSVFNTVELNGTFYRTPQLSALKRYAAATPPEFRFSVKMSKFITHTGKLKDMRQDILTFQELIDEGLEDKRLYFLFQLPPSFHYTEENLERILGNIPHKPENVIELRHASWWNETVEQVFRKAGLTFCNVDFPGLDTHLIQTSAYFYLRLHGNPVLFKSSYSTEDLEAFAARVPKDAKQAAVYFNNTYYDAGYTNARQIQQILNEH